VSSAPFERVLGAAFPLGIPLGGLMVSAIGAAATLLAMGVLLAAVVDYEFFNPFREMDRTHEAAAPEEATEHG
jgi:hypothetical protein